MTYLVKFSKSGMQRSIKSGLGLPMRFLTLLVSNQAEAKLKANPSHPVCHSQSFLFQIRLCGTDFGTVGPGTKIRHTRRITAAGANRPITTRSKVLTVSSPVGKLISGFARENGRFIGEIVANQVAIPAAAL